MIVVKLALPFLINACTIVPSWCELSSCRMMIIVTIMLMMIVLRWRRCVPRYRYTWNQHITMVNGRWNRFFSIILKLMTCYNLWYTLWLMGSLRIWRLWPRIVSFIWRSRPVYFTKCCYGWWNLIEFLKLGLVWWCLRD